MLYRKTERHDIKLDEFHKEKLHGFFPPLIPYNVCALPLIAGFGELLLKILNQEIICNRNKY